MAEMGLDPQRYVVGDQLNSLNPVTGMPEFFFSSIFKGIKKAVKSVVKVVKKIAPVVLPIAAAFFGVPFLGAALPGVFGAGQWGAMALANGIGTLIGGGNLKDAFKSAAIGGIGSLIGAGFKGLAAAPKGTGLSGFGAGLEAGITGQTPIFNAAGAQIGTQAPSTAKQAWDAIVGGDPIGGITSAIKGDLGTTTYTPEYLASPAGFGAGFGSGLPQGATKYVAPPSLAPVSSAPVTPGETINKALVSSDIAPVGSSSVETSPSIFDNIAGMFKSTPRELTQVVDPTSKTGAILDLSTEGGLQRYIALKDAGLIKEAGVLTKLGLPSTGSGLANTALYGGAAYLGADALGAFDVAEEEEIGPEDAPFGLQVSQPIDVAAAEEAEIDVTTPNVVAGVYQPPAPVQVSNYEDFLLPNQFAARGGSINYPERDLLVEGPGTEKSDDIPAMLSDGEFVINSKAVRGADPSGKGNRYAGAQNLYNLMRNFEMRA